ncbi:hypothetical protein [Streptomyces sp. NPDC101150]|uniref:hypothetical protein n=1 Tax=Streptomyces sp. NPDC101150 TaxID=3366114 RepID=UPI003800182B
MAVQTGTFGELQDCFAPDLAALIGDQPSRGATPTSFIRLIEDVRSVLSTVSACNPEANGDLDSAVIYLSDALESPEGDQPSLLAWARTHLQDAITTARADDGDVEL